MKRWTIWIMLALGAVTVRVADAQPADRKANVERAQVLYREGKAHFDIAEYVQAIASWKEAYLLSSAPLLLFNVGQAYRLSGNCAQANRFYLNYKRVEPAPKNKEELTQAMAKCAGVEPATGDAPAAGDGKPAGDAKPSGDAKPAGDGKPAGDTKPPGDGKPAGDAPPGDAKPAGDAPPGDHPADVQPRPLPAQPDANPGSGYKIAGLVVGAVGVLTLGGSVVFAAQASKDASQVSKSPSGTPWASVSSTDQAGRNAASRARQLGGLSAAALIGGGVLYWVGYRKTGSHIDVAIAPTHTEVSWSCAF